ncbi:hypothetical protein D3C86_1673960 [compost metagenome]
MFCQGFGNGSVPVGFVDAVFLVDVHGLDVEVPAKIEQHLRCFIPARSRADQQGNVQLTERHAQLIEIT